MNVMFVCVNGMNKLKYGPAEDIRSKATEIKFCQGGEKQFHSKL
jgi:hypothetical protein